MAGPVPLWKLPPAQRKAEKARRRATRETTTKDSTDMSKDSTEVIHGVAVSKFDRIVRGLQSTAQRAADATTENASEWKGAKEQGVNNKALKLCLSLDRMADDKRTDFLKAFDAYRYQYFKGWDAQPDMFEQAVAKSAAAEAVEAEVVGDDEAEPLPLFDGADEAAGAVVAREDGEETVDGPEADWTADPVNVASDDEFDLAGQWFNDGKQAGFAGVGTEANPHEDGTLAAATWEKGRAAGTEAAIVADQYNAGWLAHKAGTTADTNPHAEGSECHAEWAKGWRERENKESRKAKKEVKSEAAAPEAEEAAQGEGAEIVPFVPGVVADAGAMAAAG